MKKNGFVPIIILIIAILGVIGYFAYKNLATKQSALIVSPTPSSVSTNPTSGVPTNKIGLYKDNFLNISFEYPPSWGTTKIEQEDQGATKWGDYRNEYIDFGSNDQVSLVAGNYSRGNIVHGVVDLKMDNKTNLLTKDGHNAEINTYKDSQGKYWIEARVLGNESGGPDEIFYIKYVGGTGQETALTYKTIFNEILSTFSLSFKFKI